ncbi:hypothetical protein C1646_749540 [Rhizophagus diaphanus]|nr:hypothetical protein C1646_749540 [Rhizophagus diaphanus] [Rhizophagus sp. MUCL 43196]
MAKEEIPFTAVIHSKIPEINSFDLSQATMVIFEDLMDAPKKTQDLITGYFTHGRHKNISCIYVAQRFFAIPKAIRENVNYISLHGGHGSLTDTKRIICLYTEESKSLAPIIDDLTLQLQSQFDLNLNPVRSKSEPNSITIRSKFSPYGQKAVAEAKKSRHLIEFAWVFLSPKELSSKTLEKDFQDFLAKVQGRTAKTETLKAKIVKELFSRYKALKSSHSLDDEKIIEGIGILLKIFSKASLFESES